MNNINNYKMITIYNNNKIKQEKYYLNISKRMKN